MIISTRGRYALRMMVDLAERYEESFISLKDIAQRQQISKKYLEQIIPVLNDAGLLIASRGAQGGYRLAKPPKDYKVIDILRATEGDIAPVSCIFGDDNTCPRKINCPTLPLWQGLKGVINEYLSSVTLLDLAEKTV